MSIASFARKLSGAVLFFFVSSIAHGALINPGTGIFTPSGAANGGSIVYNGPAVPFTTGGTGGFSGTLSTKIYQDDPGNPYSSVNVAGGTGLTFVYQLTSDAASVSPIEAIAFSDFTTFKTDVIYAKTVGTDQAPTETDRSPTAGAVLTWDYLGAPVGLGPVNPGSQSALMIVRTDAPSYDLTQFAGIIDSHVVEVPSAGPSPTLIQPEPSSLVVLAIGGMLAARRRRAH